MSISISHRTNGNGNGNHWETTAESGWRSAATLTRGYQWTAYIEYVEGSQWRIWAGYLFDSLDQAQEWCKAEVAYQTKTAEETGLLERQIGT